MSPTLDDNRNHSVQRHRRRITVVLPSNSPPCVRCCSAYTRPEIVGRPLATTFDGMSSSRRAAAFLLLPVLILSTVVDRRVLAAPQRDDHQPLKHLQYSSLPVADNPVASSRHQRDLGQDYSARSGVMRCHVTTCWDSYHSAVDVNLLIADVYNMDDDDRDDDTEQLLTSSSRSYDRLTMTSAFCSRQLQVGTPSRRPPKRQGKAVPRPREGLAEERKRRVVVESADGRSDRLPAGYVNGTEVSQPAQRGRRIVGAAVDQVHRRREVSAPWVTGNADASRLRLCKALRTLINCIELSVDGCRGMLSYHSSRRLAQSNLDRCNCTADDVERDEWEDSGAYNGEKRKDVDNKEDPDDVMLNDRAATDSRPVDDVTSDGGSSISDSCRYVSNVGGGDTSLAVTHSICVVYGDPHVRTFDGSFQTCRSVGTLPLIDNDYLTVQTTNVRMGRNGGTAIAKVSVIVKPYLDCSAPPGRYLTYLAEDGRLPSDWDSDSPFLDIDLVQVESDSSRAGGSGLLIDEIDPGEHVEIYLAYIDTTVSLKLVGRYYSVSISTPPELHQPEVAGVLPMTHDEADDVSTTRNKHAANATDSDSKPYRAQLSVLSRDPRGSGRVNGTLRRYSGVFEMCVRGCPHRETVNLADYFQREQHWRFSRSAESDIRRIATSGRTGALPMASASSPPLMSVETARLSCVADGHLVGYLIDSCVFDLLNTGDMTFSTTAARGAIVDLRRFTRSQSTSTSSSLFGTSLVARHSQLVSDNLRATSSGHHALRLRSYFFLVTGHLIAVILTCILSTRCNILLTVSCVFGDLVEQDYSTR